MPDALPRRWGGQCSSVSGIPAAQTPPMPIPNSARHVNNMPYEVEKPLRKAHIEYQRIENISGPFRPQRSAAVPAPIPPTSRNINVICPSRPASAALTAKLRCTSTSRKVRIV